jgi:acetyl esterase/lipase
MEGIHVDLRRTARYLPRGGVGPRSLSAVRPLTAVMAKVPRKGVERLRVGPIGIRLHRPAGVDEPRPGLLWIHGGGYVLGAAAQDDLLCVELVRRVGVVVAAVDYRLAPHHPFPVPLEDCFDALTWLSDQPYVDVSRIAVGGASAGGGLAAAVALLARERGVPLTFQLLSYPMLDDRTSLRTDVDEQHFRLWNNKANAFGWRSYTGREPGAADMPRFAVPARETDLSGLAPGWIGVGDCDLFHDEDLAYAERLRAAGVKCDTEVVAGAFHGFDSVAPKSSVTRAFRDAQVAALAAALS